jgi:excisionase family DNA binding protein
MLLWIIPLDFGYQDTPFLKMPKASTPKAAHSKREEVIVPNLRAQSTPQREWLRVSEACEYLRISKPCLYSMMDRGQIKNVSLRERGMVRGLRLISFDSLKQFLESRATGGTEA